MQDTAEDYRERAKHMREAAADSTVAAIREHLLRLAEDHDRIAQSVEMLKASEAILSDSNREIPSPGATRIG